MGGAASCQHSSGLGQEFKSNSLIDPAVFLSQTQCLVGLLHYLAIQTWGKEPKRRSGHKQMYGFHQGSSGVCATYSSHVSTCPRHSGENWAAGWGKTPPTIPALSMCWGSTHSCGPAKRLGTERTLTGLKKPTDRHGACLCCPAAGLLLHQHGREGTGSKSTL